MNKKDPEPIEDDFLDWYLENPIQDFIPKEDKL